MTTDLAALRATIQRMERNSSAQGVPAVFPLGASQIDRHLSGGGLLQHALHEIRGQAASAFCAALAGRCLQNVPGVLFWCHSLNHQAGGIYAPGLAAFGIAPQRLITIECTDSASMLEVAEAILASTPVACAVFELDDLSFKQSRRLQIAAENGKTAGFVLSFSSQDREPLAARTRWHISHAGFTDQGHMLWQAKLQWQKTGLPTTWKVMWNEQTLSFHTAAQLASRPYENAQAAPKAGAFMG